MSFVARGWTTTFEAGARHACRADRGRRAGARRQRRAGPSERQVEIRKPAALPRASDSTQSSRRGSSAPARRSSSRPTTGAESRIHAATVLTLALAIGANASIFAVVQRVVLNPLPYPDSDRLIELDHGAQRLNLPSGMGMTRGPLLSVLGSRAHARWRRALRASDDLTLTATEIRNGSASPRDDNARAGDACLARRSVAGSRTKKACRARRGLAVLSHGLWLRRYGGDPGIVGRPVMLAGVPTEVIGVMPASFAFPDPRVDVWIAEPITRAMGFGIWLYNGVARLRDGVTVADVRTELNGLIADMPRAFPGDPIALGNAEAIKLFVEREAAEGSDGRERRACTLDSARLGERWSCWWRARTSRTCFWFAPKHDSAKSRFAGRSARAVSASPPTFLAESVLLSIAGGTIGLALAWVAVRLLVSLRPRHSAAPRGGPPRRRRGRVHVRVEPSGRLWRLRRFRCGAARHSPPRCTKAGAATRRAAAATAPVTC